MNALMYLRTYRNTFVPQVTVEEMRCAQDCGRLLDATPNSNRLSNLCFWSKAMFVQFGASVSLKLSPALLPV